MADLSRMDRAAYGCAAALQCFLACSQRLDETVLAMLKPAVDEFEAARAEVHAAAMIERASGPKAPA